MTGGGPAAFTAHSLHDLQWAVSHNSYEGDAFSPAALYGAGFRGVELDLVQQTGKAEWCVKHGGSFDTKTPKLSTYLHDLAAWSGARRAAGSHEPLFVHLDCKDPDVAHGFPAQLDGYIRDALGDQPLFVPGDMIAGGQDLMQGAMAGGWPTPAMLAGRLVLVLSGSTAPKQRYAERAPAKRLCFADMDRTFWFTTKKGARVIVNSDVLALKRGPEFGRWCAKQPGLLWRGYVAETLPAFTAIAALGVNMVAAEDAFPLPWQGYRRNPLVPDGD